MYRLSPSGPEGTLGGPQRLAVTGGTLAGRLVDGRVEIWLAQTDGERLAMMWPGEYRARLDPLVLLDEQDQVVASEGEHLQVGGGFLPSGDPRVVGHDRVFFASRILRDSPST